MKTLFGDIIVLINGEVQRIVKPSYLYNIRWEDESDWQNTKMKINQVKIGNIHSFEWGGVMTLNPNRNKNLFRSIGI